MQRIISLTFFLAMLVGSDGTTNSKGQDCAPSFSGYFSNPGSCFTNGRQIGPIQVNTDEHIANQLELEIAVRPAESGVPAIVMLNGYVTNKGSEAIQIDPFPAAGIALFCNTSTDSEQQPALELGKDSLYPNSWILHKKEKDPDDSAQNIPLIRSGDRARVLSIPIDELYDDSKWEWSWRSKTRPPASPFYSDASLWFVLYGKPKSARSNIVNLKIHRPDEDAPNLAPTINDHSKTDKAKNQISLTTDQSKVWEVHKQESGYVVTTKVNLATHASFPVADNQNEMFNALFEQSEGSLELPSIDAVMWQTKFAGGEETRIEVSAELIKYLEVADQRLDKIGERLGSIEFKIVDDDHRTTPTNPGSSKTQFKTFKLELKDDFYQAFLTESSTSAPSPTGVKKTTTETTLDGKFRLNITLDKPNGLVKDMHFCLDQPVDASSGYPLAAGQVSSEFTLSRKSGRGSFSFARPTTFVMIGKVVSTPGQINAHFVPPQRITFRSTQDEQPGETPNGLKNPSPGFPAERPGLVVTFRLLTRFDGK